MEGPKEISYDQWRQDQIDKESDKVDKKAITDDVLKDILEMARQLSQLGGVGE